MFMPPVGCRAGRDGADESGAAARRSGRSGRPSRRLAARARGQRHRAGPARRGGRQLVQDIAAALTTALTARERRHGSAPARTRRRHHYRERLTAFDAAATARELRRRVEEPAPLRAAKIVIARQVLDRLLTDRICWTPRREIRESAAITEAGCTTTGCSRRSYRPKSAANRRARVIITEGIASPAGFEPAFWP